MITIYYVGKVSVGQMLFDQKTLNFIISYPISIKAERVTYGVNVGRLFSSSLTVRKNKLMHFPWQIFSV
jgi:hypothetical protein